MADGELRPLRIEVETPGDKEEIAARCLVNEARGLPDALQAQTCVIISSGPSARSETPWKALEGLTTVAVNNALRLCLEQGHVPTYWACCDPQELVTDFLPDDAPKATTYLVANKCPASLFDKLARLNLATEIWRISDYRSGDKLHVPTASTVTLTAQALMRFKGFHRFEHYGWDCCYIDENAHAISQIEPDAQRMQFEIQNEDGSLVGSFPTNSSWIAELHDSIIQTYNVTVMGYEVAVHGPGAVRAVLKAKKLLR